MLGDLSDRAGVEVRARAGLDRHASLEDEIQCRQVVEQRRAVADALHVEQLDRLPDLGGWTTFARMDGSTEAEVTRAPESRRARANIPRRGRGQADLAGFCWCSRSRRG